MEVQQRGEQQVQQQQAYEMQSGKWQTLQNGKRNQCPKARYNHISFYYKHCFYLHGGHSNSADLQEQVNMLYRYKFDTNLWEKLYINKVEANPVTLEVLSSHSMTIYKDQLIIFGGSNSKKQCNNELLSLSLQTLVMKVMDQKGEVPSPRQSASMVLFRNQWLVLYGGISFQPSDIYNEFHFYNLQSKTWIKSEGSYQYLIQARSVPGLCISYFNDKIYLFGGQYLNSQGQTNFLNDFYEITPRIKNKSSPISVEVTRILTNNVPAPRSGHSLTSFRNKYLLMMGGQNFYTSQDKNVNFDPKKNLHTRNDVWVFSIEEKEWLKLQPSGDPFRFRSCFSICEQPDKDRIYVFGGMKTYQFQYQDLMCLDLSNTRLQERFSNKKQKSSASCKMCYQMKQNMIIPPFSVDEQYIKSVVDTIQFPFAAFGLLFDNLMLIGATIVNILYEENKEEKYIRIEDNGNIWGNDEFAHSIVNFDMGINFVTQGIDKRMKHILVKDSQKKEFGINLKLGALRIGQEFLYITQNSTLDQARVTYFTRQKAPSTNRFQYVCYYYGSSIITGKVLEGFSQTIQAKVLQKCGGDIKKALQRKNIKNTLYIYRLKKTLYECSTSTRMEQDFELIPNYFHNDLIYGSKSSINSLEKAEYYIFECCDVSLRAYLTSLYLKNQTLKIFLGLKGLEKKEVPNQGYLQKIDRMAKNKLIVDLEGMIDHDCKIVEIYYNPDLRKKVQSFHNGVLIYHKGRLITRYKYKLGQLVEKNFTQSFISKNNLVNLFGYIDVPDAIPVNLFKTDFIYNIMLEKLYSRLKLVSKYLDRKNNMNGGMGLVLKRTQNLDKLDKPVDKAQKEKKHQERFRISIPHSPKRLPQNHTKVQAPSQSLLEKGIGPGHHPIRAYKSQMAPEKQQLQEEIADLQQQPLQNTQQRGQKISQLKLNASKKGGGIVITTRERTITQEHNPKPESQE